jgi:L-threonylcarbamoyladenylate synthase
VKTVVSTDRSAAVELLRTGNVVALPTETVYGLASKALDATAVIKIFEAKDRPRFDPLIVHLPNRESLGRIVDLPAGDRKLIDKLADSFWPGPFTMVLPKCGIVPDIVTAGLDTVAVRLSAHPVFAAIIGELDEPLAAPSANRFGRISPTTARHVLDELDARIPLIIDGGPTEHGIESTVVAVRNSEIAIFRRGPITREQLLPFAEVTTVAGTPTISSPGQLPSHYAPKTPFRLVDKPEALVPENGQRVGLLAWSSAFEHSHAFAAVRILSDHADLREGAANLFRFLRELDALDLDLIVAERIPPRGLGAAIMDRLERASH